MNAYEYGFDFVMKRLLDFMEEYFKLDLEGVQNLPPGQCIVYANHSGFNGLDAALLSYSLRKNTGRLFRMVAHPFWFSMKPLEGLLEHNGLINANYREMERCIKDGQSLIIFPEGEGGNFKTSDKMYQLQDFRSGLVRIALRHQIPVVPCTILGAEESAITVSKIHISRFFFHGLNIPIPLNLIPLPSHWYVKLHDAIDTTKYRKEHSRDPKTVKRIQRLWRERLQLRIYRELKNRDRIFLA
jgi:1-acyl-sn-glycerol-3-phosphate acyltransferase